MRHLLPSFFVLLFAVSLTAQPAYTEDGWTADYPPFDEAVTKERLKHLDCLVRPKYNPTVRSYILTYTQKNRQKAEAILGRATLYFPIFEQKLREAGMPDALKYLSVVESALVPEAVSRSGAVGLWQFMPTTGSEYGLKIEDAVDERSDPHRSTDAAIRYLQRQYKRFGSWELALAAYNCGPGRVNRAVRRSGSKDFWKLYRYLPRETRGYVPAFIGATYLYKYYQEHRLIPTYPALDMQLTRTLKTTDYLRFDQLSAVTQLPQYVIEALNPSYQHGYIPADFRGNYLTLPARVMPAVRDFLAQSGAGRARVTLPAERSGGWSYRHSDEVYYTESTYTVGEGESLYQIAQSLGVHGAHLMAWNQLIVAYVRPGQELRYYFERPAEEVRQRAARRPLGALAYRSALQPLVRPRPTLPGYGVAPAATTYALGRYESLLDVARQFPGVTVQDLLEWNHLSADRPPKAGHLLTVQAPSKNMELTTPAADERRR